MVQQLLLPLCSADTIGFLVITLRYYHATGADSMKKFTRLALGLAVAGLVQVGTAQAQGLPAGVTQAMVDKGNEIYHKQGLCYACHGQDAKGLVGPNLTDDVWLHSKGSYEELVAQVTKGVTKEESKSGVPMPAKGGSSISDDDVKAVAAYVYSLSHAK
jgi:mono/diheme cytochrome c family protein